MFPRFVPETGPSNSGPQVFLQVWVYGALPAMSGERQQLFGFLLSHGVIERGFARVPAHATASGFYIVNAGPLGPAFASSVYRRRCFGCFLLLKPRLHGAAGPRQLFGLFRHSCSGLIRECANAILLFRAFRAVFGFGGLIGQCDGAAANLYTQ